MSDKGLLLFSVKMTKNVVLTNSLPHVIILSVYLHLLLNDTAQKSDSLLNIYFFFQNEGFFSKKCTTSYYRKFSGGSAFTFD